MKYLLICFIFFVFKRCVTPPSPPFFLSLLRWQLYRWPEQTSPSVQCCSLLCSANGPLLYYRAMPGVIFCKCPLNGPSISARADWLNIEGKQAPAPVVNPAFDLNTISAAETDGPFSGHLQNATLLGCGWVQKCSKHMGMQNCFSWMASANYAHSHNLACTWLSDACNLCVPHG